MYTYLIVDDEMIERKGIRMLLSRMNIRENILEASNGEEALEVFEKEKIDVLLTDINMPFMDGIELLSRIHEEYPGTETVIFSGYDEFSYSKKAISYGVSAYILKPVNPEEFEKVVGEINEKLAKSEREEKRKDESMEFLREHLLYLMVLLMWAGCVIFSAVVIMKFSGNMAHRLEKIKMTMSEVEEGNLEVELVSTERDEIGDLTRGFNQMLSRIRQLIQEVYESRIRQKQYEMTALRAQINPHFLYNSLSLINWKALEIGSDDISKATLALSRYYRTSLNKGKNTMSIREEIDNVRSYLQIQEMFHDYSFTVKMDVAEDILDYRTLNLILQPLAENAIAHGIDRRRGSEPGVITISGRRDGNCVVLSVADNGVGMEQEKAQTILTEKSSGYGVRNVNSRIQLEYGEAYGLSIESEPGKGTKVTVRIPGVEREVQA